IEPEAGGHQDERCRQKRAEPQPVARLFWTTSVQNHPELDLEDSAIIRVAIIGRDKLDLRAQIADADHFQGVDFARRPVLFLPLERWAASPHLGHESGLRLKGILIKGKGNVFWDFPVRLR